MTKKIINVLIVLVILLGIMMIVSPAFAGVKDNDHRPCVSVMEYRAIDNVMKYRGETKAPTRPQLEETLEVRHLGVINPEGSGENYSMWVYPVCGYSIDEAQMWLIADNNYRAEVDIIDLYIATNATTNGHVY
jgi:hypothetical protein